MPMKLWPWLRAELMMWRWRLGTGTSMGSQQIEDMECSDGDIFTSLWKLLRSSSEPWRRSAIQIAHKGRAVHGNENLVLATHLHGALGVAGIDVNSGARWRSTA